MDFDSIIVFLFIFAFFVLPSILKQIQAKKKKKTAPVKEKKNPSFFDRISEQVRKFLKDLEEQAQQQKKGIKEEGTVWETLSEDQDSDFEETELFVPQEAYESEVLEQPVEKKHTKEQLPFIKEPGLSLKQKYVLKSDPLQNAVIWSEILSKPLALRKQ